MGWFRTRQQYDKAASSAGLAAVVPQEHLTVAKPHPKPHSSRTPSRNLSRDGLCLFTSILNQS
jgi:hypothetical protein